MSIRSTFKFAIAGLALWVCLLGNHAAAQKDTFQFVILGDRTGEAQPGIHELVWQQAAAEDPAFVVTVGDLIEGSKDSTAETEWRQLEHILAPYRRFPLFLTPGNHDIWSPHSEALFQQHAAHPHYGFDYMGVHFTILDNSGPSSSRRRSCRSWGKISRRTRISP